MPFGTDRRLKPALVQGQNVTTLHRNKGRSGRTRSTQGWRTDIPRVRHSHRSRPNRSHHPQLTNPIRSHNEIGSRAALKEDICHQCQNELDSKQISKQIPSAHINYARLGQTVAFPHNRFGLDVTRRRKGRVVAGRIRSWACPTRRRKWCRRDKDFVVSRWLRNRLCVQRKLPRCR